MTPLPLVLIHGRAGAGKDSLAAALQGDALALADPIKEIARDVWGCSTDALWGPSELRQQPVPGNIPWVWCAGREGQSCGAAGHASLYPVNEDICETCSGRLERDFLTVRRLLQHLGTEIGRTVDPEVWIRCVLNRVKGYVAAWQRTTRGAPPCVVVPDVRFHNELCLLRAAPGCRVITVKLVRPGGAHLASNHSSEHGIEDAQFDCVITVPEIPDITARRAWWKEIATNVLG